MTYEGDLRYWLTCLSRRGALPVIIANYPELFVLRSAITSFNALVPLIAEGKPE